MQWKFRLCKLLYERGYDKQDILELARFIAWLMILPEELETRFDEMLFEYEEKQNMRYIASFERYFIEKGEEKGEHKGRLQTSRDDTIDILETRFGLVPESTVDTINRIKDLAFLKQLHREAVTVSSLDEFLTLLDSQPVLA